MAETGRGAFTPVGKENGRSFYEVVKGLPLDGSSPELSFNHKAVTLGVLSIETRLAELGYDLVVDGVYGRKVTAAVKDFQTKNGITASGSVGYMTGPVLWKPVIAKEGEGYKFDPAYIFGHMKQESGGDPGAVGYFHSPDRGLFQYNMDAHPDVSPEMAHHYQWAVPAMFKRWAGAWNKYSGKGFDIRLNCSIAQHNAPAWSDQWYDIGSPPNDQIADYVSKVKTFALGY